LPFIFFVGQSTVLKASAAKRSKRKAALNLAFGFPRSAVACGGSANSPDLVGTQTVQNLNPHAPAALGCVEWDKNRKKVSPSRAKPKPGPLGPDIYFMMPYVNSEEKTST